MTTTPALTAAGVQVLVVDRVRFHREALVTALRRPCIAGADGATDREQALRALRDQEFSVVLLCASSPDGRALCRGLVAAADPAPVIAFGLTTDDEVLACAAAGVGGYLLHDEPQSS